MDSSTRSIYRPDIVSPLRRIGRETFDFDRRIAVMAIINRTPNSFHDKGRTYELGKAVEAAGQAVRDGADWLDVGGFAFSAAQAQISPEEEMSRVVPLIEEIRSFTDTVISVDTHRAEVAKAAFAAGANILNDTNGLRDPGIAATAARAGGAVIVTHSRSGPGELLLRPRYPDVVAEVRTFLRDRVAHALDSGVPPGHIFIDPGPDLNKNTYHSLELARRLDEIASLGYPTLSAVSNKDFLGETLDLPPADRAEATTAANVFCVLRGARVLRVHDVRAAVRAARMTEALLGWRSPMRPRHNLA